jgi:hypothetical protein
MLDRSISHKDLDSILFSTEEQLNQLISNTTIFLDLGFNLLNLKDEMILLKG